MTKAVKALAEHGADNVVLMIQGALNSKGWIDDCGLAATVKTAAKPEAAE